MMRGVSIPGLLLLTGVSAHAAPETCVGVGDAWSSQSFAVQRGRFSVEFDATPDAAPISAVIGLAHGSRSAPGGVAAAVRFGPGGVIDARHGGTYAAAESIPYAAEATYHFRIAVDVPRQRYSVYVRPAGGVERAVGIDYSFRREVGTVTALDHRVAWVAPVAPGAVQLCHFTVSPAS